MSPSLAVLAFIESVGGPELLLVIFIALLLFGGEKLPGFARTVGKTLNQLKKASGDMEREFKKAIEEDPVPPPAPKLPVQEDPYVKAGEPELPHTAFPPLPEAKPEQAARAPTEKGPAPGTAAEEQKPGTPPEAPKGPSTVS